jgi:hypothetical protein
MDNQPADLHANQGARRRARARVLWGELTVPLGVIAIGVLVLIFDGHEVSWLAGVIAGGGAGAWVALRRGGARPRPRRDRGAELRAEHRTAAALEPLRGGGWRFLHGVRGLDTTFDHIAIGPGGVIVLQSISPDGVVTMRGGEPVTERRPTPESPARAQRLRPRALSDASAFRHDVERLTGRRLWVQAVVVIWSEFPAGCVTDGHCVFIHGSRLDGWLARRPHQLDPAETEDVAAAVGALVDCGGELPLPLAV